METENKGIIGTLLSWFFTIGVALILTFLISHFVLNATIVVGDSMNPTLENNDRLISLKFPLYFSNPKKGDIVIFDAPDEMNKEYIKRVIGTAGDTIEIIDGYVYVNGIMLTESYILEDTPTLTYNETSWTLNEGEFFVMGDNRLPNKSLDSRYFGPINKNTIQGIAKLRYWPISKIGIIGG